MSRFHGPVAALFSVVLMTLITGCAQVPVADPSADRETDAIPVIEQTRRVTSASPPPVRSPKPAPAPVNAPRSTVADNPGWGNASRVCKQPRIGGDSPRLARKNGKNSFSTGFYGIGRIPDEVSHRTLEVTSGRAQREPGLELRKSTPDEPKAWLLTQVGADLYQVSTCLEETAWCLVVKPTGHQQGDVILSACDEQALGTQAWWLVGLPLKNGQLGYELGSDGLGRSICLDERDQGGVGVPVMTPCGEATRDVVWAFKRHPTKAP